MTGRFHTAALALVAALGPASGNPATPPAAGFAFLQAAKQKLRGDFLLWPDQSQLAGRNWQFEQFRITLDAKDRLKKREPILRIRTIDREGERVVEKTVLNKGRELRRDILPQRHVLARWSAGSGDAVVLDGAIALQVRDQIWSAADFSFSGEEIVNGRPCLVYSFEIEEDLSAYPLVDPSLSKTRGRLWFDREDKTLIQVRGEHYETIEISRGSGSRIWEGSRWGYQLVRVGAVWLPSSHTRDYLLRGALRQKQGYRRILSRWSGFGEME